MSVLCYSGYILYILIGYIAATSVYKGLNELSNESSIITFIIANLVGVTWPIFLCFVIVITFFTKAFEGEENG